MKAKLLIPVAVLAAVAAFAAWPVEGQEGQVAPKLPGEIYVMFWNVENLHVPASERTAAEREEDEAIGIRRPSPTDHAEKLRRLRETIRRVNWGRGPDIIGFAEVESREVLESLLDGLPGPGYRIHIRQGATKRRINTALAIRSSLPEGEEVGYLDLAIPKVTSPRPTGRLIVQAKLPLGHTSLNVFVSHLKSKWNVGDATEETRLDEQLRRIEAMSIRAAVETLGKDANVLVMGDFNEDHRDTIFRDTFLARLWHRGDPRPKTDDADARLLNLGGALQQSFPGGGTHYYEPVQSRYGRSYFAPNWSILDNFLVSEPMAVPGGLHVTPHDAYIGVSWDLLNSLGTPGKLRRPHASKPYYATGVSDHLPVILRIRVHEPR